VHLPGPEPAAPGGTPAAPWWRDRRRRTRAALVAFAALALLGTLLPAVARLFAGDQRVLVVTMDQGAGEARRDALKAACGSLPGVRVVPDRGNLDPRVQGQFTVRFAIGGTTEREEARLHTCINAQPGVRGFLVEGDQ
jgi:hypothetical protein